MNSLQVQVMEYGIRVAQAETAQSVLFRRIPGSSMLEAEDVLQKPEINGREANFLAAAWKQAYAAAKERGWLGAHPA